MDNMSPEDIDYIFKQGTSEHKFAFTEAAWNNMEAMLEKQDRKRLFIRYSLFGLLIFAIVSLGGAYFINSTNASDADSNIEIKEAPVSNPNIDNSEDATKIIASPAEISNPVENDNHIVAESNGNKLANQPNVNKLATQTNDNFESKIQANTQGVSIINSVDLDQKLKLDNTQSVPYSNDNQDINIYHEERINQQVASTTNSIERKLENATAIDIIPASSILPSNPINHLSFDEKKPIEPKVYKYRKPKNNRLAFSLVAGKEWSGVKNMTDAKEGFRLGAEIAYQFGNKLQIGTGFIFSKKHYETEGTNYTPQPQFRWVDGNAPETVNGTCDVFEIPLELTYFFKGNDKNSFYASAGLSTYIMNNEWYDFRWEDQAIMADPNVPKSSSNESLDRKCIHWFGIGNISFGYKKYISKNIAAQLGTYVQVPMTGIGMGSVDLFSTGVQMKISFVK